MQTHSYIPGAQCIYKIGEPVYICRLNPTQLAIIAEKFAIMADDYQREGCAVSSTYRHISERVLGFAMRRKLEIINTI